MAKDFGRSYRCLIVLLLRILCTSEAAVSNVTRSRNGSKCGDSEFACAVGAQCIDVLKWQDGIDDCWDGSDEVCLPWQFDCKFGNPRCISTKKVNDGNIDCYSALDEGCPPHFFVCSDRSACIDPAKFQDGVRDCRDGSDEPCQAGDFPCNDGSNCIDGSLFQDGKKDCKDGSDEECTASQFECACGAVRCIDGSHFRDGKKDCSDGSDEIAVPSASNSEKRAGKCPDGSEKRTSRNSLLYGKVKFCERTHGCLEDLGQICIVVGGTWRCVCKLGTVRPVGAARCLPTELLPAYIANPAANCTEVQRDLHLQFSTAKIDGLKEAPRKSPSSFKKSSLLVSSDNMTSYDVDGKDQVLNKGKILVGTTQDGVTDQDETYLTDPNLKIALKTLAEQAANYSKVFMESVKVHNPTEEFIIDEDPTEEAKGSKDDSKSSLKQRPTTTAKTTPIPSSTTSKPSTPSVQPSPSSHSTGSGCKIGDKDACRGGNRVCVHTFDGAGTECGCKTGWEMEDGACYELHNECASNKTNDCDPHALCMDGIKGYECLCKEGYLDISPSPLAYPGRDCLELINECASASLNDCSPNSRCIDKPSGFTCRCFDDFVDISSGGIQRPGRNCTQKKDECSAKDHDCDAAAICTDVPSGFTCSCPVGFADVSPDPVNKPGRVCAQLNVDCDPCDDDCDNEANCTVLAKQAVQGKGANPCHDYTRHDCDAVAECYSEQPGYFQCRCPRGYTDESPDSRYPGRKCTKAADECALGTHNCDAHAECIDTPKGFDCRCKPGWRDASRGGLSGRICVRVNQCTSIDCAPEAECRESPAGPICQCISGYVDISRQHGRPLGRVCRAVVNECAESRHDCSSHAACIDTAEGYACRCNDGYRDESPQPQSKPGRVCVRAFIPDPPECDVNDPLSCDQHKSEVCVFLNGTYKCRCAVGYNRLPDGRCLVINECADKRLHTCSPDAACIDQAEGYTCQCNPGYADLSPNGEPGRICRQRANECSNKAKYGVDCSPNAICVDRDEGYECRCRPGFADVSASYAALPGRQCVEAVDECADRSMNDCSDHALCEDTKEGYSCACRAGFVDASPDSAHYPGRVCRKPIEKIAAQGAETALSVDECDPKRPKCARNEVCSDKVVKGHHVCACADNAFRYQDGSCRLYSACSKNHDCDRNAACLNMFDSYTCQCRAGFIDISPDPEKVPGRRCKELINECATGEHACHRHARCIDATDGYACVCQEGFTDTSSTHGLAPGRRCSNAHNECAIQELNTCDENADCVDTPDGYTCQCYAGFIDVSSMASLPPGRVCTVQTTCPKQKTDLMFLIDGSGSIGSYVFKNEVLRFVREFVELFEIGPDRTRVGLIQYSDQIRHEFDLAQNPDKASVLRAITETQYLTGLTRTGAAIQHMVKEGFSERRGARARSNDVSRVAIVLTDGRSQDNVTDPAMSARKLGINTFAIGVTDHVLASELETIAGSPSAWFYVDRFKDLDTRLRSMIQKVACPQVQREPTTKGTCNPIAQTGCDRSLNELCVDDHGRGKCVCPEGFQRHPVSKVCGGSLCNPQLLTSCIYPEACLVTPFLNHRCACPEDYTRDYRTGYCVSIKEVHISQNNDIGDCRNGGVKCAVEEECVRERSGNGYACECRPGYARRARDGRCAPPGTCDPSIPFSCDIRKREQCLPHGGAFYTCQCAATERRHPVTGVCLRNECLLGLHDCDRSARCIDTDDGDGYICACPNGFMDRSADTIHKPGRLCIAEQNECTDGSARCSPNALCTDTETGYVCRCKSGYVDYSPNPAAFPGLVCRELVDECRSPHLNNCDRNAICIDTMEAYTCVCKAGFVDEDEFRNPGRRCKQLHQNDRCAAGKNDCDRNARCIQIGDNDYSCACPAGFRDKSPDVFSRPGRVCIPVIPECDNPALNDCDSPDRAICTDTDDGYMCRCRSGFLDISPSIRSKPGRLCKQLTNECALGSHDCSSDGGICEDTPDSYTCRCALNYLDVSFDRVNRPGRKCKRLVDECATGQNDCSAEATCTDTEDSYICACLSSHMDVSPDTANRPGRRCLLRINECTSNRHDCSSNADCIDTPQSYQCRCRDDFDDESPDRTHRPGRVCRPKLVDECRLGRHDCHQNAFCRDLPQGYTCECRQDFLDQSPNRASHPGRMCSPRPTPPPDECRLDSDASCKQHLNEVCRLVSGVPKCSCPVDYQRDAAGACTVTNECSNPALNDCNVFADCIDQQNGYTCRCRTGFKDMGDSRRPGRTCKPLVNECQYPHLNDCHTHAQCIDKEEGYECRCHQGHKDLSQGRPGRVCKQLVNECGSPSLNSCDKNARCIDEEEGYRCECKANFLDISPTPTFKGRACRAIINECSDPSLNDCDRNAKCRDTPDSYECECPANSKDISPSAAFPGRVCLVFENECQTGRHDCDPSGICHDNEQSFTCECPAGFADRSPNKLQRPGRVCVQLIDECRSARHTCSPQADCRDLEEGYTCECREGYVDRSPSMLSQPGRVCQPPEICPPQNECSSASVCTPLGGNKYECACIQGYADQSPGSAKGRVCVRNNACRDPRLNTCSRNAICYDEAAAPGGYRCECMRGFVDRSDDPKAAGRVCEAAAPPTPPPRHPCQDPQLNDCHPAATCRTTGPTSYTCECLNGYADKSPERPGRICVLTQPVCLDPSQNDCHAAAICSESRGPEKFTCQCRDGYVDQSPDKSRHPGRICVEQVNECLSRSLNDCDPLAVCEDAVEGYSCRCPVNTIDQSPDKARRPGRKCFQPVNECAHPSLNSCSRFADCFDREDGYECRCRTSYHDDNPSKPGTKCTYVINECESANLNDCDAHAECIDKPGGYDCRCKPPYRDEGLSGLPGRVCHLNECKDPTLNNCDQNAACVDTDDGYYCTCNHGFYDNSPNPAEPGRVCLAFQEQERVEVHKVRPVQQADTIRHDGTRCGANWCQIVLNEVCISGAYCGCRPGQGRAESKDVCVTVEQVPMRLRVVARDRKPLLYSSVYGSEKSPGYVEIVDVFKKDIARTFGGTSYAPRYVTTEMNFITHPKTVNSNWPDGLLMNFDVEVTPKKETPVDQCDMWQEMTESLQRSNNQLGGGSLEIAMDADVLSPCHVEQDQEPIAGPCGGQTCRDALGEVCLGGTICGCPNGYKRSGPDARCYAVEGWNVPLIVMRSGNKQLAYNRTFANPHDSLNKEYVKRFETGVGECYPQTLLKSSYITSEVNDIVEPMTINSTLDRGLLFNSTMYFRKGAVRVPSDVYYSLVRYIKDKNHDEIGESELYISDFQLDPFKPCFKNTCAPSAKCIDIGTTSYRCECNDGYRDLDPSNPGRKCQATKGYNECERSEDNECSENARCIDLEHLYKCECLPSFTDASPPGSIAGSMCVLDYCSDIDFCPRNTTCKNLEQQAECRCDPGFADIRKSEKRVSLGMGEALCMNIRDVDECALGLTNCSGVAECTDKPLGYTCKCPENYIDGNPEEPGRVCGALLCDLCNAHGDCVHNAATSNITCVCTDGWAGEFCQVAPSNASTWLMILLALLFLLLALCCLLYFCTRCHCFPGGAGRPGGLFYRDQASAMGGYRKGGAWPWSTLEGSSSSESGERFSAGSAAGGEYYPDVGIPRAKLRSENIARGGSSEHVEVTRMEEYIDRGLHIPRAHLAGASGRGGFDTISEASSGYTIREEIERKVITDVTTKEIKTTTTTDESGNTVVTTAEIYHPGSMGEVGGRSGVDESQEIYESSSSAFNASSSSAFGASRNSALRSMHDEQERGESIAEFSIGRATGGAASSRRHGMASSGDREITEYIEEGDEIASDAEEVEVGDSRVRVSHHHSFDPLPGGGAERIRKETVKTSSSTVTNQY